MDQSEARSAGMPRSDHHTTPLLFELSGRQLDCRLSPLKSALRRSGRHSYSPVGWMHIDDCDDAHCGTAMR
eukprot:1551040-Pyramimonas_sp.AAC.1